MSLFSVFLAVSQDIHRVMWNLISKCYVYFHNNNKPSPEMGKTKSMFSFSQKISSVFFSPHFLLFLCYITQTSVLFFSNVK